MNIIILKYMKLFLKENKYVEEEITTLRHEIGELKSELNYEIEEK